MDVDDRELDAFLTQQLADAPVADGGFTGRVGQRLRNHRRRRRAVLWIAVTSAAIPAAWTGAVDLSLIATVPHMVAAMVLAAVCAVIWIATESRDASLARLR